MIVYYKKDGVYRFVSYLKKDEGYDTSLNLRSSKSLEVKQIAFAIDMVEADGYEAHVTSYAEFERVHKNGRMWMIERRTENVFDYLLPGFNGVGTPKYTADPMEAYCSLSEEMAKMHFNDVQSVANAQLRVIGIWTDYVNPNLNADFIVICHEHQQKVMFLAERLNLKKGIALTDCSMKAFRMNLDEAIEQFNKLRGSSTDMQAFIIRAPKENVSYEDIEEWWNAYKFDHPIRIDVTLNEFAGK